MTELLVVGGIVVFFFLMMRGGGMGCCGGHGHSQHKDTRHGVDEAGTASGKEDSPATHIPRDKKMFRT